MQKSPKVSIIIPHHNNYDILLDCINSIYCSTYKNFEIIIVNNASNDSSISKIVKKFPLINIVDSEKNLGYAGGCNLGVKTAIGENLFFLNNDTKIDKDSIQLLLDRLDSNNEISSVQPKIKNLDIPENFDYAGGCGGFIDYLVFPFCKGRIFNHIEKDNGQYDTASKIFWASGAGFLTKKKIFLQMSGFDNSLFAHMEEIDYHWKCYLAGYQVWVEPKSKLFHLGGATLDMQSAKKLFYNHRNSLVLLLSNYSLSRSFFYFLLRIPLEVISSIKELISLRPLHFINHYIALLWILFNLHKIANRRRIISKIRILSDSNILKIIFKKSIVLQYFILNKKKFSDLS